MSVRTPRERVQALGDQELIRQHFDVESDLNELLALTGLLEERVASWPTDDSARRGGLLKERGALIARGELLACERIARPSAINAEPLQQARSRWTQARLALAGLAGN
ncbi:MAG: hypothetical protein M3Y59_15440 [Myxococcota bacterium]|nr:hypothetical protein [Myxococcota bacterium]